MHRTAFLNKVLEGECRFCLKAVWFRSLFIGLYLEYIERWLHRLLTPVSQQGRVSDNNLRDAFLKNVGSEVGCEEWKSISHWGVEEHIAGCVVLKTPSSTHFSWGWLKRNLSPNSLRKCRLCGNGRTEPNEQIARSTPLSPHCLRKALLSCVSWNGELHSCTLHSPQNVC